MPLKLMILVHKLFDTPSYVGQSTSWQIKAMPSKSLRVLQNIKFIILRGFLPLFLGFIEGCFNGRILDRGRSIYMC